jgi:hypothetical protein
MRGVADMGAGHVQESETLAVYVVELFPGILVSQSRSICIGPFVVLYSYFLRLGMEESCGFRTWGSRYTTFLGMYRGGSAPLSPPDADRIQGLAGSYRTPTHGVCTELLHMSLGK